MVKQNVHDKRGGSNAASFPNNGANCKAIFYPVREISKMMSLPRQEIYNVIRLNSIPVIKVQNKILIPLSSVKQIKRVIAMNEVSWNNSPIFDLSNEYGY